MRTRVFGIAIVLLCGARLAAAAADEIENSNGAGPSLLTSLAAGDFTHVDARTDTWRDEYELGKLSGDDYLDKLKNILPQHIAKSTEVDLRNWTSAYPKSYAASFVLGEFYDRLAFELRGGKFRNETTSQQFSDFTQYQAQARDQLLASTKLLVKAYPSYCELIDTSVALKDGHENEYFIAGTNADPQGLAIWRKLLNYHARIWGGSVAQMNAIVDLAEKSRVPVEKKKQFAAINFTMQAQDAVRLEHYQNAIELYRKAYAVLPAKDTVWRLVDAADAAKKGGMFDSAVQLYGKALAADPANLKAHNNRGWIYENERKDFQSAFSDYRTAADLGSPWAQKRVAWLLMTGKGTERDLAAAQQYLEKAAKQGEKGADQLLRELAALRAR